MQWNNEDTQVLAMYITETTSGLYWLGQFFWKIHKDIAANSYDENEWLKRFRTAIIKGLPDFFDGSGRIGIPNIDSEKIDWEQLYTRCLDITKPRPDLFKKQTS